MQNKSLLYGLIGFFIGGFVVAVATTLTASDSTPQKTETTSTMSMDSMTDALRDKRGDAFDQAFIENMIAHHEGAVEMAQLADGQAKHEEIKQLSKDIISAQQTEVQRMRQWQQDWGYDATDHAQMSH